MHAATMNLYGVTPLTAREMRAINGGEGTNAVPASTNTVQQVASTNPPPAAATSGDKVAQTANETTRFLDDLCEMFEKIGNALEKK